MKPYKIIHHPLPKLYVFDSCPFSSRVRLCLGLKNIKHCLNFLQYDAIELMKERQVPTFEYASTEQTTNSMTIIHKIEADKDFGPIKWIHPASHRKDLQEWFLRYSPLWPAMIYPLIYQSYLPEVATCDAKTAFIFKHPLPPYSLNDWQNPAMTHENRINEYNLARINIKAHRHEIEKALLELSREIQYSPTAVTQCSEEKSGASLDDIDLWPRLRLLTLNKDIHFPNRLWAYMRHFSIKGDIPLFTK